jgi:hypothetical protein
MHKQVKVQKKQQPKDTQWYIQNTVQKTKTWKTLIPHKKRVWTQLPRRDIQFLLHWYKSKLLHLFLLFLLLCTKYSPCSWIHLRCIPTHNFHWLVSSSLTFDCTPSAEEFRVYILWPSCQNGFMYLLLRTVMHANIETFVTFLWTFIFSTQKKNTKNNHQSTFTKL